MRPERLSHQLREGSDEFLARRRKVTGLTLLSRRTCSARSTVPAPGCLSSESRRAAPSSTCPPLGQDVLPVRERVHDEQVRGTRVLPEPAGGSRRSRRCRRMHDPACVRRHDYLPSAGNYSGRAVKSVPSVADPDRVVKAILRCIERPRREVTLGQLGHREAAMQEVACQGPSTGSLRRW